MVFQVMISLTSASQHNLDRHSLEKNAFENTTAYWEVSSPHSLNPLVGFYHGISLARFISFQSNDQVVDSCCILYQHSRYRHFPNIRSPWRIFLNTIKAEPCLFRQSEKTHCVHFSGGTINGQLCTMFFINVFGIFRSMRMT